jgi:lysophospholipase L1-like esterase
MLVAALLPARLYADEIVANFRFGSGPVENGRTPVDPKLTYDDAKGYGFEPGASVQQNEHGVSANQPFYFSLAVPEEGNYRVTVTLGDLTAPSTTTVKAELRRLMLRQVRTDAGKLDSRSFIVNVRTPKIPGGGSVKLKGDRETKTEAWAWDQRITLEFNGSHPSLDSLIVQKVDVPTIYLLGDSTVCDQPKEPYASWGQMLTVFFKPDIAIANHAESGETVGSSSGAHRFDKVLSLVKPGDYVFMQFGHNDSHAKGGTPLDVYKATLKKWTAAYKEKGAKPVLITPMHRHTFEGDHISNSLREYPQMVREAAKEEDVPLIDLNMMSQTLYETLGPQGSIQLFEHVGTDLSKFDATHHSPYGAYELARCVVQGIRAEKLDLANHILDEVPPFDPAKPDGLENFDVPASPAAAAAANERPLGN